MRNITIYFDGGSLCNIPRLGYGEGYGSFQIECLFEDGWKFHDEIVRVKHGPNHSNNSAEVLTLVSALEHLKSWRFGLEDKEKLNPKECNILIIGDSRIALDRVFMTTYKHKQKSSQMFRDACAKLHEATKGFASIKTKWVPRKEMVAIFGH